MKKILPYDYAINGSVMNIINTLNNPYNKNFWYDLAGTQMARKDYASLNDVTIAPTFKIDSYNYFLGVYDMRYGFRFRIDSVRNMFSMGGMCTKY